jgi:hypothetical protein
MQTMIFAIKYPAFLVTALVIGFGVAALMSKSELSSGALFFIPFALGPLFVSLVLAVASHSRSFQKALIIGSILYATWFGFVFLSAFYWYVDPQSVIALIFVGIYSLPVMIPIWIISLVLKHRTDPSGKQHALSDGDKHSV